MTVAMAEDASCLNLHATPLLSRANGPGQRLVIWFQGCTLQCRGCFNPESHNAAAGYNCTMGDLLAEISKHVNQIEGITLSGGEPFQQSTGLLALLKAVHREHSDLSVLVFSGYRLAEIENQNHGPEILAMIDILIAGRYVPKHRVAHALLGSSNQQIHYLGARYCPEDIKTTPQAELVIGPDGTIAITGIDPPQFPELLPG